MEGHKEKEKKTDWAGTPEIKFMRRLLESRAIYVLIAFSFILFIITRSSVFSMLSIMFVLLLLIGESLVGVSEHGAKKELYEVGVAVVAALVIWFGASFLLSTPAPLNAIVSCSMLPNLERGDLVILRGAEPNGIDVNVSEFDYTEISAYVEGQGVFETNISLAMYCGYFPESVPCKAYSTAPEKVSETYGPIEFRHGWCKIDSRGVIGEVPCVKSAVINGKEYLVTPAGDTIVYTTLPTDQFSRQSGPKEVIHRVIFKVHAKEGTYYLTKGDNNDRFDIQFNNAPAIPQRTSGKVIARVPYLGYFKLFLFGFFEDPAGCDRHFVYG